MAVQYCTAMKTFTAEDARKNLGRIITDAIAGESTLITYHGIRAALVVPVAPPPHPVVCDSDSGTATESHGR
jgi:antitoxin (DNA-binding transcriptional repressor) of toxin-antitoxin stability system